ncbi:MAG: DUF4347 domain-containing protein, partial [Gammaproteobacteria bacterium]|nr:DUF4347 domain-containing protein [Gammaproteobacteria bacterium]
MKRDSSKNDAGCALLEELEPRLLLSADLAGGLADHDNDDDIAPPLYASELNADAADDNAAGAETRRVELVIVDSATPDFEQLIADIRGNSNDARHLEIAVLDSNTDGVSQISALLNQHNGLSAVHIFSHGSAGNIFLGDTELDLDGVLSNARAIQAWGDALTDAGDILLYGCDLAANNRGSDMLALLSDLTGADVAASDDLTGAASLGGDWVLEHTVGRVEASIAVSADAQRDWDAVLATPELWISPAGDVSGGGAPGDDTWTASEVVKFGDPSLVFDPVTGTTTGTFSSAVFSLETFTSPLNTLVETSGIHYVSSNITVGGANAVALQEGDILLVTNDTYTFTSTNSLTVDNSDVFVFRPDTAGDYSSGTFTMLLDNPTGGQLAGVSLIEEQVVLPDITLEAGDFLLLATAQQTNVLLYETTDVGSGTTSGIQNVLLNGADTNVAFSNNLTAIDLVEKQTTVGGVTLTAGTLLTAVDGNTSVGGNGLNVQRTDIFTLTINATTLGSGPGDVGDVTATLLLDGSDIDLNVDNERPFGISLSAYKPTVTVDPLTTNDSNPQLTGTINDTTASISVTV